MLPGAVSGAAAGSHAANEQRPRCMGCCPRGEPRRRPTMPVHRLALDSRVPTAASARCSARDASCPAVRLASPAGAPGFARDESPGRQDGRAFMSCSIGMPHGRGKVTAVRFRQPASMGRRPPRWQDLRRVAASAAVGVRGARYQAGRLAAAGRGNFCRTIQSSGARTATYRTSPSPLLQAASKAARIVASSVFGVSFEAFLTGRPDHPHPRRIRVSARPASPGSGSAYTCGWQLERR